MVREIDFVDECYADKDLSLLKKLTLVIPTYNRNYYLSRCLWYHAHFPFGQIIVADSSPEEKKVVNRETVAKIREMFGADILYLEYEPETEKYGGDIYRKWGDAVMHVETEYSIVCTDKEFMIPSTLVSCIVFLNENRDYDIVDDIYYLVEPGENTVDNVIRYHYPNRSHSIDESDKLVRLEKFVKSVDDTYNLLSLRRSTHHKFLYKVLAEYNIDDLRFGELCFELLSILSSKYKYLNCSCFKLRDMTELRKSHNKSESSASRYPTLECYKDAGIYDYYMERSVSCFISELNIGEMDKIAIENMSDTVSDLFIEFQCKRHFFRSKSKVREIMVNIYWKLSPKIRKYADFVLVFTRVIPSREQLIPQSIPREALPILEIISENKLYHKLDKSIVNI